MIKLGPIEISDELMLSVRSDELPHSTRCIIKRATGFASVVIEGDRSRGQSMQFIADALYRLSCSSTSTPWVFVYISTFGGTPRLLSEEQFQAALEHHFPDDAARVRDEQVKAAQIKEQRDRLKSRGSWRAQRERHIIAAKEIEESGQPPGDLPALSGTPKQIAWALDIRAEFALRHPGDAILQRATRAQYWIENYRTLLTMLD